MPASLRLSVVLAFATVYVVWGSTYLAILYGIQTIPPFMLAGTRFLAAGAVLYAWGVHRSPGERAPTTRQWRDAVIVGGLMFLGGNGLVTWAEQTVPSGVTALIVASVPMFVVLFSGRMPSVETASGILLGFAGIAILVGPGSLGGARRVDLLGAAGLVLASASWAAGSVYSLRADRPASATKTVAMQMLGGGALLLAAMLAGGEVARFDLRAVSARSAWSLLYLIVLGSLVAFSAYMWLLRVTTPDRAATYAYVNPVVAVLLGFWLAGEPLTWRVAAAGAVIVVALVLILRGKRRKGPEPRAPLPSPSPSR
jgi:drug/metabolite transporter (DMT)-like permease